jgi:hypothetical protein
VRAYTKHCAALLAVALLPACASIAFADDSPVNAVFAQAHIDGQFRAYYFDRIYQSATTVNANALSGALLLTASSGKAWDLSAAGSLVAANALGTMLCAAVR